MCARSQSCCRILRYHPLLQLAPIREGTALDTQRRGVVLLVEENGQYRISWVAVSADSDDEAIQRSTAALAFMSPSAKVVRTMVKKRSVQKAGEREGSMAGSVSSFHESLGPPSAGRDDG